MHSAEIRAMPARPAGGVGEGLDDSCWIVARERTERTPSALALLERRSDVSVCDWARGRV